MGTAGNMSEREFADALREETQRMVGPGASCAIWDSGLREDLETDWVIVKSVHRDSNTIDRSNYAVFVAMLDELKADYVEHRFNHWAVGWMDHLVVRVRTGNRLRKELLRELASCYDALEDYPLLDEEHHSQMEWDAHEEKLCDEHCPFCEELREEHRRGSHHQIWLLSYDDDGDPVQFVEGCIDCEEDLRHHENYCSEMENDDGSPYRDPDCEICMVIEAAERMRRRALHFAQHGVLPFE